MSPERPQRPNLRTVDGFRAGSPRPYSPVAQRTPAETLPPPQPIVAPSESTQGTPAPKEKISSPSSKSPRRKWLKVTVMTILGLVVCIILTLCIWYQHELAPANTGDTTKQTFVVKAGATPHQIADGLEQQHLIRSAAAFYIYLVMTHQRDTLQAGSYMLTPSISVHDIVAKMTHGAVSNFSVTFYPGGTLNGTLRAEPKYSVTNQLKHAGFSQDDIRRALTAQYTIGNLFAGKPAHSSLEGYIYGDTYNFAAGTSATDVIARSLNEFAGVINENNLTALYKKQHLSLYQGIILASIVQRELDEGDSKGPTLEQREVAQVFLTRLKKDMPLGSDVTYYYGAEQLGVAPSPDVDSPYNTRKYAGLPPGPIATPGLNALLAVAHPASTNYLFFLSGDDGKVYFSTTDSGHQQNIKNHCQQKCQY